MQQLDHHAVAADQLKDGIPETWLCQGLGNPLDSESLTVIPGLRKEVGKAAQQPKQPLSERVKAFVDQTSGWFSLTDVVTNLGLLTGIDSEERTVRQSVSQILGRLVDKKQLIKGSKKGTFRRPTGEADAPKIDFLNASTEPVEVHWPLGLEEIVRLYPKNLVVVGGSQSAGKTAYLLNFAMLNMEHFKIKYLSSEMKPEELTGRLEDFQLHFKIPLEAWDRLVDFRDCSCDCLDGRSLSIILDFIDPNGITIIDYLEIDRDFHKIAGAMRQIYDRLNRGVALIGLQKDPEAKWPRGRSFAMEKPRLAIALDYDKVKRLHHLEFLKSKARANRKIKPEDMEFWFDIEDGAKLILKEKQHLGLTIRP